MDSDSPSPDPPTSPATLFGRCPTHWLIRQMKDRWALPVLSAVRVAPRRFSELREELHPVSPRMLGRTLKKLVQIGFVRRAAAGVPLQARYEVTDLGRSVAAPFARLLYWSQINIEHVETAKARRRPAKG